MQARILRRREAVLPRVEKLCLQHTIVTADDDAEIPWDLAHVVDVLTQRRSVVKLVRQRPCQIERVGELGGVELHLEHLRMPFTVPVFSHRDPRGNELHIGAHMPLWMRHPEGEKPVLAALDDAHVLRELELSAGREDLGEDDALQPIARDTRGQDHQ